MPFRIVRSDIPVACATAAIPPRPKERASAAAHRLRPRSSKSPIMAAYLVRIHSTTRASGMHYKMNDLIFSSNTIFGTLLLCDS